MRSLKTLVSLTLCQLLLALDSIGARSDNGNNNNHSYGASNNQVFRWHNQAPFSVINYTPRASAPIKSDKTKPNSNKQHITHDWIDNIEPAGLFFNDFNYNTSKHQFTVSHVALIGLLAKYKYSQHSAFTIHKYDSFDDLKLSGGPKVEQEKCLRQLEGIKRRAVKQSKDKFASTDVNLFRLLDTYGKAPPGLLLGKFFWPGAYGECTRLEISFDDPIPGGQEINKDAMATNGEKTARFCWTTWRLNDWPKDRVNELEVFKSGVCVPKACDSLNYKNKFELITSLFELRNRDFIDPGQMTLVDLYCLPDEESPLRAWYQHSPATQATMLVFVLWVSYLVYATYKYEKLASAAEIKTDSYQMNVTTTTTTNTTNCSKNSTTNPLVEACKAKNKFEDDDAEARKKQLTYYGTFAITKTIQRLFDTTPKKSNDKTPELLVHDDDKETSDEEKVQAALERLESGKSIVDIGVIDGIKVISMIYIVIAHALMYVPTMVSNEREASTMTRSPAFFLANMLPAFAVNSFFSITGLLTSYAILKQNLRHKFITSPVKWSLLFLRRYVRIMPIYLITLAYLKYVYKFLGSGPFWDYGTTIHGPRQICEKESWTSALLLSANFDWPMHRCILSDWYLANDFQFFLLTPLFMIPLYKNPDLGRRLIKTCVYGGLLVGFLGIMGTETADLTPVAKFAPHGFKTYTNNLGVSYTRPHHRVPAYLVGLLVGYWLYCFEQDKLKYWKQKLTDEIKGKKSDTELTEPQWSESFQRKGARWSLFFCTCFILSPFLSDTFTLSPFWYKFALALTLPCFHLLYALSVGTYVVLASTGYAFKRVNSFLSAQIWKPLARLSICAMLINLSAISYIAQTAVYLMPMSERHISVFYIAAIGCTYAMSFAMHVLFESPLRGSLDMMLMKMLARLTTAKKMKEA